MANALMQDDEDDSGTPDGDVGGALLMLAIIVALMGFICWRVWPYIAHAGMH